MSLSLRARLGALVFMLVPVFGVAEPVSELPAEPIYLWAEKPLIEPDREHIKDQRVYAVDNPSMTPFWPTEAKANGAAVVIFPGGGYVRLAINHEGYDIAKWFAERGVAAFVVKYRMQEYGFPAPLLDGLRAVRLVRKNAADWGIDPAKIGVVGFSAGGHLAASVSTRFTFTNLLDDPLGDVSARPDFAVLGYPVIALYGPDAHAGSRKALLGENPEPQLLHENSLQYQVTDKVPPVFILHGIGDQAVPVGNSLAFFTEVQKHNKQSELHIYQTSIHGVGMIQGQGSVSNWPQALEAWLAGLQVIK
ncbi:alpha/beta hydrolase [Cellvibrio sp. KY-GH-1]|uniref:alpha/beta hydrolase n=1 Tax=Cellvibrio sp. KY-GH-1 TaxID=2303332 RepID=UPI0012443190|nr:alpha/beta hydrolase [Cellvibrio sp. KY-GH-1]QEY17927.1 alpha/beta hydrolase [Cellvibrio sp. KY-GH-1]